MFDGIDLRNVGYLSVFMGCDIGQLGKSKSNPL